MPYENEHSCRIRNPNEFQRDSFRRIKQGKLSIIIGKLIGEQTMMTQAYRYNINEWTEREAEEHCAKNKGKFEAAKK